MGWAAFPWDMSKAVRGRVAAVCAFVVLWSGTVRGDTASGTTLETLKTAHEVHSLLPEEAARRHPVRIRGVVAYYDPYVDPDQAFMFLHDRTGDIFVFLPKLPLLAVRQGTPVEVTGVSDPGEFAPTITHAHARVLPGTVRTIHAERVELPLLLLGGYDARFATVTGVVQAVFGSERSVVLKLSTGNGVVRATTLREPNVDYSGLIDSQIQVRANIGPQFNHRRQVTGVHLFFADMRDVEVIRKPERDPFAMKPRPIDDLIKAVSGLGVLNRIRIQGRATLQWPGRLLCLQDTSGGLCVESAQQDAVTMGEMVSVVGFPSTEDTTDGMVEARFRRFGAIQPIEPEITSASELLRGKGAGGLVTIVGKLIDAAHDTDAEPKDAVLTMEADGKIFRVVLPRGSRPLDRRARDKGSVLRLTGVCLPELNRHHQEIEEREAGHDSFRLLLRTQADVEVLETPSWWNGPHVLYVFLGSGGVVFAGTVWVIALRRRVKQQTGLIRESEERFRHLAEHDGLTGLANRLLLHERLREALEAAKAEDLRFAVLMMDLDKFKQVNDTFGHHTGDAMLCAAAARLSDSVRQSDTVARMGGDEFVVVLPALRDEREAGEIADRIVVAIASPFAVDGVSIPMSASVGVCVYPEGGRDPEALFRNCDAALYGAKGRGRNCWQPFIAESSLTAMAMR